MNKLTIPTILIATVLITGIFAFMPIEKATTVHTTIQGTQFNEVDVVFVDSTVTSNATAGCGSGNQGIAYWTVSNLTLADSGSGTLGAHPTSVFQINTDGVADGLDAFFVELSQNQTAISGVLAFDGTGTDPPIIIGFTSSGLQNIGDISLSVLCRSGGTAAAGIVTP